MTAGAAKIKRIRRAALLTLWLCGAGVLTSCAKTKPTLPPGLEGIEPPPLMADDFSRLRNQGERNWVLNLNEMAVDAMRHGNRDLAKRALDEAILYINDVFGSTSEARQARSLFFSEGSKLYKGDPYERSMTFFYRGVLYMQDHDWDNARAMFRSAIFQDSFTEEEQNANDWATFEYLIAVCETQMNRPFYAQEAFDRAVKHREAFLQSYQSMQQAGMPAEPEPLRLPTPEDTLLVIVQTGKAPQKLREGEYGQLLAYRRGMTGRPYAKVEACGTDTTPPFLDSVYYQASTRGGRYFDAIQGRKVFFKSTSADIGTAGIMGGAFMAMLADSEGQQNAGLIVVAAGLALTVFSELVQTKADTRQWTSLPDALALFIAGECQGPQQVSVFYSGSQAATTTIDVPPPEEDIAVVLAFPPPGEALLLSEKSTGQETALLRP